MNRQIKTSTLLRRFAPYFKKYRGVLALDLFCASLTTVCELVLPLMVRFITERGMNDMASLTVALVLKIGGFIWCCVSSTRRPTTTCRISGM